MQGFDRRRARIDEGRTDGESRRASRLHPHLSRFRCQIGGEFAVRRRIVRKLGRIEDEINESGSDCLDSVIIG